jgi:dTMP kinase
MDLDAEQGLMRKRRKWDSFEREEFSFHQRVREGYTKLAAANPDTWITLDATLPESDITNIIWDYVREFITYGKKLPSPATSSL